MRSYFWLFLTFFILGEASAQTFSAFLSRVNSAPNGERPAIVDSFMLAVPGFPYIESTLQVHFLYRGEATSVTVPGDANNWTPSAYTMVRIGGTDLWYFSNFYEADARLDYKFVLNGSNWILDPRNPYQVSGGFGPNSELRMPDFVQPPGITFYPEIAHGSLRDTMFHSDNLNNTRRVRIYTPPNYNPSGDCYPLLLIHDGLEYITLANTDRILDYLIANNQIQPLIAVFVPPVNREPEYAGNQQIAFGRFITEELLPFIDSEYITCTEPEMRGTAGASNGGNISLWLGVTYPDIFGLVCAQSPYVQQSIFDTLLAHDDLGLRFYGDMGTYDIPLLIPLGENLLQILQDQDYPVSYQIVHEGHSWGNWRGHIDEALIYLYPSGVSADPVSSTVPDVFQLAQNFPNPFNPTTKISFNLTEHGFVSLQVFDTTGRLVESLVSSIFDIGKYEFVFDGTDYPSGIYFARLSSGNQVQAIKMVLLK